MARGKGRTVAPGLTAYLRTDGTERYAYNVDRTVNGKREQRSMTLKDPATKTDITSTPETQEADDLRAMEVWGGLRTRTKQGESPVPDGDLRLDAHAAKCFAEWERDVARGEFAEGTLRNYKGDWRNHVQPYFNNMLVAKITHVELTAFLQHMEDKPGRGGKTMASYTVDNSWKLVRNLMRRAYEDDRIPVNPVWRVSRRARPTQQPRPEYLLAANERILDDVQLTTLLDYMREKEEHYVGITTCLAFTGMRLQEAAGLRPSDCHGSRILLGQQLLPLVKGEEPRYGKRKEQRLGIVKRLYRAIPVMPRLEQELLFQAGREPEGSRFLFSAMEAPGTRPMTAATINRAIGRSAAKCGLWKVTPKDLRRTAACVFAAAGIERQVASQILGHDPEVYDANYARAWADEREAKKVVEMLGAHKWGMIEE